VDSCYACYGVNAGAPLEARIGRNVLLCLIAYRVFPRKRGSRLKRRSYSGFVEGVT